MGFLRRLGQRILVGVTIFATAAWVFFLAWLRNPIVDWSLILAALLISSALGWWPFISLGIAAVLGLVIGIFPGLSERSVLLGDLFIFWAIGIGWGQIARFFLRHHESFSLEETHAFSVPQTPAVPRSVGRTVVPAETSPLRPPALSFPAAAPTFADRPTPPEANTAPVLQYFSPAPAPPTTSHAAPEPLSMSSEEAVPPASQSPSLPSLSAAPPLMTQEINLGDFRQWAASQQASSSTPQDKLPSGLMARRSSSEEGFSSASGSSPDANSLPETDPSSPNALLLEWYNQFSSRPWSEDALRRRYPGGRWEEPAARHVREALALRGTSTLDTVPKEAFDLEDVVNIFRCERLFELRRQGHPDLHPLSPTAPLCDWLSAYQKSRSAARGGSGHLVEIPAQLQGQDPARVLVGRPSALLDVAGQSEVVALITPLLPQEPMTWAPAVAAAHLAVAASLGFPLSGGLVVIALPVWDEQQPRLTVVEDLTPEFRRLDGALARMRQILSGEQSPRAQSRVSVCNACGRRHACPNYLGQRPRLNLSDPPPLFSRFQP